MTIPPAHRPTLDSSRIRRSTSNPSHDVTADHEPTATPLIIDAHQHLWDPETGWYGWLADEPDVLQRRFEFTDIDADLDALSITGTVLVQAADRNEDTDSMLAEAHRNPRVLGVVAYLPLEQPGRASERLQELQADPYFVGVRTLIHNQADPDWLLRPDVGEGLALLETAGVPFDLVAVLPRHLEHVPYLTSAFPNLTIIIDHLAKPPVGTSRQEPWSTLMQEAAACPQVMAKISGLYRPDPPAETIDDELRPWIHRAYSLFGPDRLMLGSDWPVSEIAGGYRKVTASLLRLITALGDEPGIGRHTTEAILGRTAERVYRLKVPSR